MIIKFCLRSYTAILFSVTLLTVQQAMADEIDVWIGTSADGIYFATLDTDKGKLSKPILAASVKRPGFLALHPNGKTLYATVAEESGSVVAFSIGSDEEAIARIKKLLKELEKLRAEAKSKFGASHPRVTSIEKQIKAFKESIAAVADDDPKTKGQLTRLNGLSTGDGGAACIGTDKTGRVLFSAQYGGGSTTSYTVKDNGELDNRVEVVEHGPGSGVLKNRQKKSHPHWVGTSPDNRFLMVPDLGMDRVVVYELDVETAKLKLHSKIETPPGSGPRHMKFHTTGKFIYVLNELSLTVSVFEYGAENAEFKEIQVIETLPEKVKAKESFNSAAEIRIHPSGNFVYTSNRGNDSITVFSVDQATGKLTFVEREAIRGSWPRNFNLDPTGKWLIAAGQHSNTLTLFNVDQKTGELTFARESVDVPQPICVLFGS